MNEVLTNKLISKLAERCDADGYVTLIDEFGISGVKVRFALLSKLIRELADEGSSKGGLNDKRD